MGKRRTFLLCGTGTTLALITFLAHTLNQAEPSYQGQALSQWIKRLADTNSFSGWAPKPTQDLVLEALRHMGTNAAPVLADWACYDRPLRRHLLQTLPPVLHKYRPLRPQIIDDPHGMRGVCAGKALILLGPEASPTFPKLGTALTDEEFFGVATRALWILREIGEPAVPTLAAAMTNKPSRMRFVIAMNLGHMGPEALAAVPALQSLFGDPEPGLRSECIRSIEAITGKPFTNSPPQ